MRISSVEVKSFMGYRTLAMHTSHDELRFKTFVKQTEFEKLYALIESLRSNAGGVQSSAPPNVNDPIRQLKELGELHSNVLNDEEFQTLKAKVMRSTQ